MALQAIARAGVLAAVALSIAFAFVERSAFAQSETVAAPVALVVGGTPAGVAAAIAVARRGENVTLVVAADRLGGILTDAMLDQWDLNRAPGGASVQSGLFAELYRRLGETFSPEGAAATLAAMVSAEPRIDVRYGEVAVAAVTAARRDGRRIERITFRNLRTSALSQETAPFIIDATDDGDVAALAGARYDIGRQDTGRDLRSQAVTLVFAVEGVAWQRVVGGYDAKRFGKGGATRQRVWGFAKLMRAYRSDTAGVLAPDLNLARLTDATVTVNAIDVYNVDGLDARQVAEARRRAMREAPRLLAFMRRHITGFERARLGRFAPGVYVRETRHISGLELLTASDIWAGRVPADSIGLASYPLDLHPVDAADRQAYAPARHVYGVPFGALIPKGIDNLVLASPAISATHLAAGSARIVPTTIEEGEAAGAAAVLARRSALDALQLATRPSAMVALRDDLARNGALLPVDALAAAGNANPGGADAFGALATGMRSLGLDGSAFLAP